MMNFRKIKAALVKLLGDAAAGRYTVIGYDSGGKAAEEIKGAKRLVQVYYQEGDFAKSAGRMYGDTQHAMKFAVILTVSAAAKLNLAALNAPGATAAQIKTAIEGLKEAGQICDDLFDELADIVYQVLMDALNDQLGTDGGIIANRWVSRVEKGEVLPKGELVVLDGTVMYSCSTVEAITGDTPLTPEGGVIIDTQLDIVGDDVERTGVTV